MASKGAGLRFRHVPCRTDTVSRLARFAIRSWSSMVSRLAGRHKSVAHRLAAGRRFRASPALGRGWCAVRRGARLSLLIVWRPACRSRRHCCLPAPLLGDHKRIFPAIGSSPRMVHVEVLAVWALCVDCVGMQRGRCAWSVACRLPSAALVVDGFPLLYKGKSPGVTSSEAFRNFHRVRDGFRGLHAFVIMARSPRPCKTSGYLFVSD